MKTCIICDAQLVPNKTGKTPSKLCSDACTRKRKANMAKVYAARQQRRCTNDGCDKPYKAKGLCGTHYNDTLETRYRTVTKTCDACGNECSKQAGKQRYAGTYCSILCRDDAIRKEWPTSELPADHWARWYGATSEWAPPVHKPTFIANACNDCGTTFIEHAHATPSDYCSTACQRRTMRRRRRAREHNAAGEFTYSQIMRQYARQGWACAYCKQPAQGLPDPEHVTPLSRGGRNDMSNLVAACRSCNSDKGDLLLHEWADSRTARGLAPRDIALVGSAYTHLRATEATAPAWRDRAA